MNIKIHEYIHYMPLFLAYVSMINHGQRTHHWSTSSNGATATARDGRADRDLYSRAESSKGDAPNSRSTNRQGIMK